MLHQQASLTLTSLSATAPSSPIILLGSSCLPVRHALNTLASGLSGAFFAWNTLKLWMWPLFLSILVPYLTVLPMLALILGPLPSSIILYFLHITNQLLVTWPSPSLSPWEQTLGPSCSPLHPQCLEEGLAYNITEKYIYPNKEWMNN